MSDPNDKPSPEASQGDTIAGNRALPVPNLASVPPPARGYRQTPAKLRLQLRRLDNDLHAELIEALVQCGLRNLKEDFGRNAPDGSRAALLAERIKAIKEVVAAADLFSEFVHELHNIAINDAVVLLEDVNSLVETHLSRDPGLGRDYSAIRKLFEARAKKISEGLAKARQSQPAPSNEE